MSSIYAEHEFVNMDPTFPRRGRLRGAPLKVDDDATLDLLHQRLQTLVQHPLGSHAVGASCQGQKAQTQQAQSQQAQSQRAQTQRAQTQQTQQTQTQQTQQAQTLGWVVLGCSGIKAYHFLKAFFLSH